MAVNLAKGQKVSLTKNNPGLKNIIVGLGWNIDSSAASTAFDLDASAFLLNSEGRVSEPKDFVFYGNLSHPSGAVMHKGGSPKGVGFADNAKIKINLSLIPAFVVRIAFTATIYEADEKNQTFSQVSNAYIRIYNEQTNEELLRYNLSEDFSVETAVVFGELYKNNGEWKFNAMGNGSRGGLAALCGNYGVEVG